tara:strand:- start:1304 stop:1693 length:390 start_codon:yes stop_codon:yes gene_type:complete
MPKSLIYILVSALFISCSNILYNHNDAMSMLTTKQLVIDRFGEPTQIINTDDYDEYYYDFGVFTERVNYFAPQISTVSERDSVYNLSQIEVKPQYRIKTTNKYLKFHIQGEAVIYWESQAVNFSVKKND